LDKSFKLSNPESRYDSSPKSNTVINLSRFNLTDAQVSILSKGLTFVPTPKISIDPIIDSIHDFARKFKIFEFFPMFSHNSQTQPSLREKSSWSPPDHKIDPAVHRCISSILDEVKQLQTQPETNNISKEEIDAIKYLKGNSDIVIKKSDKSAAVVIMDKCNYIAEGLRQLSNPNHYKQIPEPLYLETAVKVAEILERLHLQGYLTKKQLEFLLPPDQPRQRIFYMLPKIHKDRATWPIPNAMPPGRPIVSDCSSESERVSIFIDDYIKTRANLHPSYIKDTYDFLDKVRGTELTPDSLLITLDVDSMYTNINHDEGIQAVKNIFSDHLQDSKFTAILELLELSLKCNDFIFDDKVFLQVQGTAMGRRYAPHYADIYMAEFERQALAKCKHKPDCYYRYLDDIFIIWSHGSDSFNDFLSIFNSHRPSIKFKAEINPNSINFLDTTLFRSKDNRLEAKVYFKPTDTHQLLHKLSFHPKHTFPGLIKSQVTRFYRICSFPDDVQAACLALFQVLGKRNYSRRWLRKIKNETLRSLVSRDRPGFELQIESTSHAGAGPCNSTRCLTCEIVPSCHNFTSSCSDVSYAINSKLSCESSNIIYLYTCKLCAKQYIGETGWPLRHRNNQHRSSIVNGKDDNALYNHLAKCHPSSLSDAVNNFLLIPIEQVPDLGGPGLNQLRRLERENAWIDTLCTFEPYGLNVKKFAKFDKPKTFDLFFTIPFSKTGSIAAKIVKKHIAKYNKDEYKDISVAVAYKKHSNLKDILVRSRLK